MAESVVDRVLQFNAGREPERLALKYAAMRRDPFAFFRGTAHLFYADWPARSPLDRSPLTWACGDMHLENFGSYRGANGLAYFDINDFDEAALAPAGRDLARFTTSMLLAATLMGSSAANARQLCSQARLAYGRSLRLGKAMWVERATARGLVRRLLRRVKRRTRADLLAERTVLVGGRRRLRIDGRHALSLPRAAKHAVARTLAASSVGRDDPAFFRVIDVARRIAGTGSLGIGRYVVLVYGHGPRGGNVLLDLKRAAPSVMAPTVSAGQPRWRSEADRVVTIQRRVQAVSPALLHAVRHGRGSYILRELQPFEDRLSLGPAHADGPRLEDALRVMAELIAWGQLRGSGRQGSATGDELIAFGRDRSWGRPLMEFAGHCASTTRAYWKEFATAYDSGGLAADGVPPSRRSRR